MNSGVRYSSITGTSTPDASKSDIVTGDINTKPTPAAPAARIAWTLLVIKAARHARFHPIAVGTDKMPLVAPGHVCVTQAIMLREIGRTPRRGMVFQVGGSTV